MQLQYILVGRNPIAEPNLTKWSHWLMTHNRILKKSYLPGGIEVSTVFLGLDHGMNPFVSPILFETMIFGGKLDLWRWRYKTYGEALAGHNSALNEARKFKNVSIGKKIARSRNRYHKRLYRKRK